MAIVRPVAVDIVRAIDLAIVAEIVNPADVALIEAKCFAIEVLTAKLVAIVNSLPLAIAIDTDAVKLAVVAIALPQPFVTAALAVKLGERLIG